MEPVSIRADKTLVPPVPAPTQLPAGTAPSTSDTTQPAAALRPGKRTSVVVSDYQLSLWITPYFNIRDSKGLLQK